MPNKVFYNEKGYEEIVFEGDQAQKTMTDTLEWSLKVDGEVYQQTGEIRTLVDVTNLGFVDEKAAHAASTGMIKMDYDKLAFIGVEKQSPANKEIIKSLVEQSPNARIFDARLEAEAWLLENPPPKPLSEM